MTRELYEHAKTRIPGGVQLLSKRPELFLPGEWPSYYRRASGVEVEDLDGRTYVDVSIHAVGSCPLGYADPDVEQAVIAAVRAGSMATLNCPEEVELADVLCELHPWADKVRYARTGGEAMAVATRIARAATGRDRIAICGYHGWHDWDLAAALGSPDALDGHLLPGLPTAGLPSPLQGTVIPFPFGDSERLEAVGTEWGDGLAAIVMEPARYELPPAGFLEGARAVADRVGAVLIFDEITTGFRLAVGGCHLDLGVDPDIAVLGKGMSNGYPMAAVIGRGEVMDAVERTFMSSTYWSERIGPAAALATIGKLRDRRVPEHLDAAGRRMRSGWERLAREHGLDIRTRGVAPLPRFAFRDERRGPAMATLYTQLMLDEGYLASGAFYPSFAHREAHVDEALDATGRSFARIRRARDDGLLLEELRGEIAWAGLRR